ncbi:hypothetical protein HDU84_006372 [Entophlyctis sp. JEL0112]|nr:hypothetical protein HDU84_006372 [Entophlyctis sp. JEL0112]
MSLLADLVANFKIVSDNTMTALHWDHIPTCPQYQLCPRSATGTIAHAPLAASDVIVLDGKDHNSDDGLVDVATVQAFDRLFVAANPATQGAVAAKLLQIMRLSHLRCLAATVARMVRVDFVSDTF